MRELTDGVYEIKDILPPEALELSTERIIILLVAKIAKNLTDAKVKILKASRLTVLEFDVAPEDRGPLLGGRGSTIFALRTIAKAILGPLVKSHNIRIDLANDEISERYVTR